jgi:hypothetical protein
VDDDSGTVALRYCKLTNTKMLPSKITKLKQIIKTSINQRISAIVKHGQTQVPISKPNVVTKQQVSVANPLILKPMSGLVTKIEPTPNYNHLDQQPQKQPQASYQKLYESRKETRVHEYPGQRSSLSPRITKNSTARELEQDLTNRPLPLGFKNPIKYNKGARQPLKPELEEVPKKAPSPIPTRGLKSSANTNATKPEITASKLLEQFNISVPRPISKMDPAGSSEDYLNKLEEHYQSKNKQDFQQSEDPNEDLPYVNLQQNNQGQAKKAIDIDISKNDDPYIKALEIIEAQNLNFIFYNQIVEGIKAAQKNK